MLTVREGVAAVHLARRALDNALGANAGTLPTEGEGAPSLPPVFDEPRGAFVTLKRYPDGALRGCIGYPLPVLPLRSAIAAAAVSAATEDYRFRPVRGPDLSRISIEVSVLTVPTPVRFRTPDEAIRAIVVGRDGLIVDGFGSSGLLLPQVAPEEGWTPEELLEGTCEKAGLPRDTWKDPRVQIRRFEAQIFRESSPAGEVVRSQPELTSSVGGRRGRKT